MKIVIAGAGIGGLTAGLCLAKSGHQIEIYEKVSQFAEVGAGLQCGANGMHVFDYLGLTPKLSALAVQPNSVQFRDYLSGDTLHSMPLGDDYRAKYGAPYLHIHRADLHAILLEEFNRVAPNSLHLAMEVDSFTQSSSQVTLCMSDNQRVVADCFIAADGVHSRARQQMFGNADARFTGNVAWRGVVPVENLPSNWMETVTTNFVGPKKHMVLYYLRNKRLANFVGVVENKTWTDDSWVAKAPWQELKADFEGWHPCVQMAIDAMDKDQCYRWALYEHKPLKEWASGRVALLGDAAHATLPFMASGAAMAIEDARVLQRALDQAENIHSGLSLYQRQRRPRTTQIQKDSARAGRLYHFESSMLRKAAFTGLKLIGKRKEMFLPSYNANICELI